MAICTLSLAVLIAVAVERSAAIYWGSDAASRLGSFLKLTLIQRQVWRIRACFRLDTLRR